MSEERATSPECPNMEDGGKFHSGYSSNFYDVPHARIILRQIAEDMETRDMLEAASVPEKPWTVCAQTLRSFRAK